MSEDGACRIVRRPRQVEFDGDEALLLQGEASKRAGVHARQFVHLRLVPAELGQ